MVLLLNGFYLGAMVGEMDFGILIEAVDETNSSEWEWEIFAPYLVR